MLRTIEKTNFVTNVVISRNPPKNATASFTPRTASPGNGSRIGLSKALQTVAVLQTTLELGPLIRLFSREINTSVVHSGISYVNQDEDIALTIGRRAKHRCGYQLHIERQALGTLDFMRGKPFSQKELATLEYFLGSLVYPLRNALKYKNVFQASLRDPLTDVFNRAVMQEALAREGALARRHRIPLSLIVLDIDGFKKTNDRHGHQAGDQLIKVVADAIVHSVRNTDMVFRYGGDEFTILLSNTSRRGATVLAEQIRKTIKDAECVIDAMTIRATVSIGIATLNSRNKNIDLFARADEALFEAKQKGRNQVVLAGSGYSKH